MDTFITERGYFTPNDVGIMADSDSRSIQNAVDAALKTGLGRVVIPRYNKRTGKCQWDVDQAIILDSNLEIVLDNCYIRQMDGSMDNVFRNFHSGQLKKTLAEEQHDIIIRGIGNAIIDGGNHNGLTETTSNQNGLPHIFRNNMIFLHNVRDFALENFALKNQRHWAIHLCFAEKGLISGLDITCDSKVQNLDGVDLRVGCNNIVIQNLTGQAGDDFIALTGLLSPRIREAYQVEGKSTDIHDVVIQNIMATSAECTLIALRNHDGVKIYNITVDNIHDVMTSVEGSKEGVFAFDFDLNPYPYPKSPYAIMRIGHDLFCSTKSCGPGDVYGIHVSNLHARCNNVLILNMDIEDSYFGNIYADNSVDCVISARSERSEHPFGVNMRNVTFENIFYHCRDNANAVAFDFGRNTKTCLLENVQILNANVGNCPKVLIMEHRGTLELNGIHGTDVKDRICVTTDAEIVLDGQRIN